MATFPTRENAPSSVTMEAVTVISPGYEDVGLEAVKRFNKFARCNGQPLRVTILSEPVSGPGVYARKLDMDGFRSKSVVFFDADYWLLRPVDFGAFENTQEFIGVRDHGTQLQGCFPREDCANFGLPPESYINTGFFIFHPGLHHEVWPLARELMAKGGMADHGEQSYLNLALHKLNIPRTTLPVKYNFWKFLADWGGLPFYPRGIIGLHGAGIPANLKVKQLTAQAEVFETPQAPLCQDEWLALNTANYSHEKNLL
jgi:hypothetical protein